MGTSKGYEPPKGANWHSLKIQLGKLINSPDKKDIVVSKFITAIGGATGFSSSNSGGSSSSSSFKSSSARNTIQSFGSFLSDINTNGLKDAIKSRSIDLNDVTVETIKDAMVDYFVKPTVDADSACASKAISTVIDKLFDNLPNGCDLEDYLSSIVTSDLATDLICSFYENYIYELFCRTFFEYRTENISQDESIDILDIVKLTIEAKVSNCQYSVDLRDVDFNSDEGSTLVQGILKDILEILEVE
jgi:hypothetical protein